MSRFRTLALAALLLCTAGCSKQEDPGKHGPIVKIAPYLYEVTFTDYSAEPAEAFYKTLNNSLHGACCSAVRKGDYVGRNLDYFYDKTAEFVVHVPRANGRYASVGVSSCDFFLTTDIVDEGKESSYFALIPYFTVDGVNEKGVYASINMVSAGDMGRTTGTNPGAKNLCASMVVRYVLDNFASAKEACEGLAKMNISTVSVMGEFHYFIADATGETYYVELINNRMVYKKLEGKKQVMTNFYLTPNEFTPHANGIERYNILADNYDATVESSVGMHNLMQKVRYSQAYDPANKWISDFYGFEWNDEIMSRSTPESVMLEYIQHEQDRFKNKERDMAAGLWITVHESVYNIVNKTLSVYSQEGEFRSDCIQFSL